MKLKYGHSSLILYVLLVVQCETFEVTPRSYPRLRTLNVSDISNDGATFNAEFYFRGNSDITSYGFVWSKRANNPPSISTLPNSQDADRIDFSKNITDNKFSARINTTLEKGEVYFIRSYVITNEYTVYGNLTSFESLGSGTPEISSFAPNSGTVGDTLSIFGKGFSYIKDKNTVLVGARESNIVFTSDTLIKAIVPAGLLENSASIAMTVAGNKFLHENSFTLTTPLITSYSPTTGTDFTEVSIEGNFFSYIPDQNHVLFGNHQAEVLTANKKSLKIKVPPGIVQQFNELWVKTSNQKSLAPVLFTMLPPTVTDFQPKEASIDQSVTIYGQNFGTSITAIGVFFDGVKATITSASANQLVVKVPSGIPSMLKITVTSAGQTVEASGDFTRK